MGNTATDTKIQERVVTLKFIKMDKDVTHADLEEFLQGTGMEVAFWNYNTEHSIAGIVDNPIGRRMMLQKDYYLVRLHNKVFHPINTAENLARFYGIEA